MIDVFRNFYFLFNKDIDECTDATSGCQQICTNSPGSFSCSCFFGHTLKSDNKTCEAPGNFTLKYVSSSQFCWFKRLKSCCLNICAVTKKSPPPYRTILVAADLLQICSKSAADKFVRRKEEFMFAGVCS